MPRSACWPAAKDGLEGAKREIEERGGQALVCVTDVSQFDQVEAAAVATEEAFGPIDLWINVAMVSMYSPFMEMTHEEFKHIVEVTFLGSVYGTHCALKRFQPKDKGVIVQVGSALAFRSIPLQRRLLRVQARAPGVHRVGPVGADAPGQPRPALGGEPCRA